ncbi:hypothetical protein EO087_01720 [Dyella sp. M7H15-1]|uniref:hypothetical protein n=1 Tax=Dyella sp. M7H15-1 TaxID=2501295 RepID=UPI001005126F|nr:hypothetical protein [Dyella sp. M7H15-1]QAU22861.1 hypothetical protein EO087_01720 [Dyella sp. M7H15-1]
MTTQSQTIDVLAVMDHFRRLAGERASITDECTFKNAREAIAELIFADKVLVAAQEAHTQLLRGNDYAFSNGHAALSQARIHAANVVRKAAITRIRSGS